MKMFRPLVCIAASALLSALSANATPYASAVTNNNGTIQWRLNETVNGYVYVLFDDSTVSNFIGNNLTVGPQSFSLGSHTNFAIYIFNIGTGVLHQISPNPSTNTPTVDFFGPRGVTVNRNPSSPYFGTIYVANASGGSDSVRTTYRGVYAINPDYSDAFGQGTNSLPPYYTSPGWGQGTATNTPPTGFIGYGSSTTYGVWRVFVGPDDMVYIADASGAIPAGTITGGGVWMCPPDLSSATDLFPYNGTAGSLNNGYVCEVGTPCVTGSYAAGTLTLYTCEWNRSPYQNVWQYQFFTTNGTPIPLPWDLNNSPNALVSSGSCPSMYSYGINNPNTDVNAGISSVDEVLGDSYVGPDGRFYCCEARSSSAGYSSYIYDNAASGYCMIWDGEDQALENGGSADPFWAAEGIAVSDDNQYVAATLSSSDTQYGTPYGYVVYTKLGATNDNGVTNVPILPLTAISYNPSANTTTRGVAFDKADNIYAASGSDDSLRCFSMGLTTLTITSNDYTGSNGGFLLTYPAIPQASVTVSSPLVSQANAYGNPISATFTFSINAAQSADVTVPFTISGTATNGRTYTLTGTGLTTNATSGKIVIPAGQTSATITMTPSATITSAVTLTAVLTITASGAVAAAPPIAAPVAIANTGPQAIAITGVSVPSFYRGLSNDFASFVITRYGDTNAAQYTIAANAFSYAGTATAGVDYAPSGAITVNPGDQTETGTVSDPVVTGVYHGNESVQVSLNGNSPVTVVGSSTASLTLVDNEDPPAQVLWSDTLSSAADSVNWTLTFANSNLATTNVLPIVIPNYPNYTASNPDTNSLDDFDVEFGYAVTNDGVGLSPVMLAKGWTNALKVTVNKIDNYVSQGTTGGGCSAGVNLYPQGLHFSGNYAFRFSMCLTEGVTYTTEFNTFGINHYGTNCNWFAGDYGYGNGTTNSDGDWFWIDADVDGWTGINSYVMTAGPPLPNSGWALLTDVGGPYAPYTTYFQNPVPYNGYPAGVPQIGDGNAGSSWADVEIKQVNNVITMSINKFPIIVYNNTNYATSGDIMLGYDDPFASVGNVAASGIPGAGVYYSNARVVQLTPPEVTGLSHVSTNLTISFTDTDTDDTPASFTLKSAAKVQGPYSAVSPAPTFTQATNGVWSTTVGVPSNTTNIFYVVHHN
jgi:hypothetical protein